MATSGLYGSSPTGAVISAPGSESAGLYGNGTTFGGSYFEWFIFIQADTQPATPTGGSWSFQTNSGTPPTGWSSSPPAAPTLPVWVSIALVNSRDSGALVWSAPGVFSYSSGLPILSGSGSPTSGDGLNNQLWIQTGTTPETIWFKQSGTWVRLTGSTLYVDTTSNQTIAGTKTFSDVIVGSVSGTANNVTGIVSITNGGTGQTSANSAFNALAPSQTGNSGKYLTTNGTDTSWATNPLGTVTSVSGTGIVSGVTLSGTVTTSGSLTLGGSLDLSSPPTIGNTTPNTGAFTTLNGTTITASTKVATPYVDAVSSAGGALRNASGTAQLQWGGGGGNNLSLDVSTNMNGANAQIDISPTGTGHVHIKPTGSGGVEINPTNVGTMDNMTIGGTTPRSGSFTTVTASTAIGIGSGGTGQTTANAAFNALAPSQTGNSGKYLTTDGSNTSWATNPLGTVTSVAATVPSFLSISGSPITTSGTLAFGLSGTALPTTSGGTGLTSFTANGVVYASSTSALTTGSALTFDGTNLGFNNGSSILFGGGTVIYSDANQTVLRGKITNGIIFQGSDGSEQMRLTSTGLGIGMTNPQYRLGLGTSTGRKLAIYDEGNTTGTSSGFGVDLSGTSYELSSFVASNGGGQGVFTWGQVNSSGGAFSEKMRLNGSGNLGIGTNSPLAKLSIGSGSIADENVPLQMNAVSGTGQAYIGINNAGNYGLLLGYDNANGYARIRNVSNTDLAFSTNDAERIRITAAGDVGIGTSSAVDGAKLSVYGNYAAFADGTYKGYVGRASDLATGGATSDLAVRSTNKLWLVAGSSGANSAVLDSSGNLGLGLIPASASSSYGQKVIQFGPVGAIASISASTTNNQTQLSSNVSDPLGTPKYIYSDLACAFKLSNGNFYWYSVGTGTPGATAPFSTIMYLDTSGYLGLGISSPTERLDVYGSIKAANSILIGSNGTYAAGAIYSDSAWGMIFRAKQSSPSNAEFMWSNSADTERMRISTSGALLINTTSNPYSAKLNVNGYSMATDGTVSQYMGAPSGGIAYSGTATNHPWGVAINGSEAARFTTSGYMGIGTSSPNARLDLGSGYGGNGEKFLIYNDNTSSALSGTKMGFYIDRFGESNSLSLIFPYASGTSSRFHVAYKDTSNTTITDVCYVTGGSSSWSFASDARMKDIIAPVTGAIQMLSGIQPVYYSWKNDVEKKRKIGTLAQDWLAVAPEVVDVPETEFNLENSTGHMTLAATDTIPILIAAIQEQQAIIESLKARLDAANL